MFLMYLYEIKVFIIVKRADAVLFDLFVRKYSILGTIDMLHWIIWQMTDAERWLSIQTISSTDLSHALIRNGRSLGTEKSTNTTK